MDTISDEELVWAFKDSGEMRHIDELVHRHIGKVRGMIYSMVLNHADADEITQDVFMRMANSISRFKQKARFSTWLYTITMNTARTFLRRRSSRPLEHRAELPDQPSSLPAPDRSLIAAEADGEVAQALSNLSPSLRSAITLIAIQGLNVTEAARIDNCLVPTMYWRVHEARRLIKKQLELTP